MRPLHAPAILKLLVSRLRKARPQVKIILRADCQLPPALPCGLSAAGYLAPLGSGFCRTENAALVRAPRGSFHGRAGQERTAGSLGRGVDGTGARATRSDQRKAAARSGRRAQHPPGAIASFQCLSLAKPLCPSCWPTRIGLTCCEVLFPRHAINQRGLGAVSPYFAKNHSQSTGVAFSPCPTLSVRLASAV